MCGIMGVITEKGRVADTLYKGLKVMENRGREGSGLLVANPKGAFKRITGSGFVDEALRVKLQPLGPEIKTGEYYIGIGQNRYGTTGVSSSSNFQPIEGFWRSKDFFLVHNGNIVNLTELQAEYDLDCPSHYSDTRIIALAVTKTKAKSFQEAIINVARKLKGAFNLIYYYDQQLYILTDRFGFHPLQLGQKGKTLLVASESAVFRSLKAKFVRDIGPGELIIASREGCQASQWTTDTDLKFDIFEFIYFMRQLSQAHGVSVSKARKRMGYLVADELTSTLLKKEVDPNLCVVCPVPESGNQAALGLFGALRKHYPQVRFSPLAIYPNAEIKRTFINPTQLARKKLVKEKFDPDENEISGEILIVVDDSMVRGTTLSGIAKKLRKLGARQIHAVIACPQYLYPCLYGVDTYREGERLASAVYAGDREAIARALGLDSISFSQLRTTIQAVMDCREDGSALTEQSFYAGPFNMIYPDGTGDYALTPE